MRTSQGAMRCSGKRTSWWSVVNEHWTDTRQSLVLTGSPVALNGVAGTLRLPADDVLVISPSRAVLALWGDALSAYRDVTDGNDLSPLEATRSAHS